MTIMHIIHCRYFIRFVPFLIIFKERQDVKQKNNETTWTREAKGWTCVAFSL